MSLTDFINAGYQAETGPRCPIRGSATGECPRRLLRLLQGAKAAPAAKRILRTWESGTARGEALAAALRYGLGQEATEGLMALDFRPEYAVYTPMAQGPWEMKDAKAILIKLCDAYGAENLGVALGDTGLAIRSRCDVVYSMGGRNYIVEFKTKNDYGWKKLPREGIEPGYLAQVGTQLLGCEAGGLPISEATIIYENKDSNELFEMPVDLDHAKKEARGRLGQIYELLVAWAAKDKDDPTLDHVAIPEYASFAETERGGSERPLPWQCNYCAVGPVVGKCVDEMNRLADKNEGKDGPRKWVVKPR